MRLYHFPVAPNPARVLCYLREKGIPDLELTLVNFLQGEQKQPEFLALSPRGVVPVLELDDGTCLFESVAIIEYLEELYPDKPMIGADPLQRQITRATERYIEMNVFLRLLRLAHSTNSPLGLPENPAIAQLERARLPEGLKYVDELIGAGPFVMGERVSIADCTLLAGINFANFCGLDLIDDYPHLKSWFERYALRHL